MLSGSKRKSAGALFGSVPDFSPHSRMKLADSLVRFCAHGTSPVAAQLAGMYTVLAAAEADGMRVGTRKLAAPSAASRPATSAYRRQWVKRVMGDPSMRGHGRVGPPRDPARRDAAVFQRTGASQLSVWGRAPSSSDPTNPVKPRRPDMPPEMGRMGEIFNAFPRPNGKGAIDVDHFRRRSLACARGTAPSGQAVVSIHAAHPSPGAVHAFHSIPS